MGKGREKPRSLTSALICTFDVQIPEDIKKEYKRMPIMLDYSIIHVMNIVCLDNSYSFCILKEKHKSIELLDMDTIFMC